ncbi:MAG: NAD(P)H-dependent glycerol-3-phosphate dehydrogenase [Alphaproteobacteria bacterium]
MTNKLGVIGCGRWGGFLAWYGAKYCNLNVEMYDIPTSPAFLELSATRKNSYLTLLDNMQLVDNLKDFVSNNDMIIISIGCQHLRGLAKELNQFDLTGKYFLLAIKGLEAPSGKTLSEIFEEEINQDINFATLSGPGHVQDYMKGVPSCAVIDSADDAVKEKWINLLSSELIRFYFGTDFIGNQVGAALKNVIGIAAGILDGLEWYGLKGALMARAPIEVGRLIEAKGGDKMSAYGLAHLGDYEATLFSPHSHNRSFGEKFAKGEDFGKLAEGVATLKAVKEYADAHNIDMPISQVLFDVIYNKAPIKESLKTLFERSLKREF